MRAARAFGLLATGRVQVGPGVLERVARDAVDGNPEDVLRVVDEFGWSGNWMMNIGDVKGKILDEAVERRRPQLALELGTYLGYSAVRIARLLGPGARLV